MVDHGTFVYSGRNFVLEGATITASTADAHAPATHLADSDDIHTLWQSTGPLPQAGVLDVYLYTEDEIEIGAVGVLHTGLPATGGIRAIGGVPVGLGQPSVLAPSTWVSASGVTLGELADLDEGIAAADGTEVYLSAGGAIRLGFPAPSAAPDSRASAHLLSVRARASAIETDPPVGELRAEVWVDGGLAAVADLGAERFGQTARVATWRWGLDPSHAADGSDVEIRLVNAGSTRMQIDAVELFVTPDPGASVVDTGWLAPRPAAPSAYPQGLAGGAFSTTSFLSTPTDARRWRIYQYGDGATTLSAGGIWLGPTVAVGFEQLSGSGHLVDAKRARTPKAGVLRWSDGYTYRDLDVTLVYEAGVGGSPSIGQQVQLAEGLRAYVAGRPMLVGVYPYDDDAAELLPSMGGLFVVRTSSGNAVLDYRYELTSAPPYVTVAVPLEQVT